MNSYSEFIIMKSNSWIKIEYNEFSYLNSYTYEFIYELGIHTFEFIYMNSYTHEFIYSFHIWIHIMIIWIHMYMNSYDFFIYEFICFMNSYMNSGVPRFQMLQVGQQSGCTNRSQASGRPERGPSTHRSISWPASQC